MYKLFAVSAPGLEPFTAMELRQREISSSSVVPVSGGVEFTGDLESIYHANLQLRTASRILLRLGHFHAAAFSELDRHSRRLPWENYISPDQAVALHVSCHKSRLYHSTAVAKVIIKTIGERLGKPVVQIKFDENSEYPHPQLVIARLVRDQCTLSIDTSGCLLHRRGYRLASAKAPLRETLAAGMLLASGWDGTSPLLDPFCGSGTIAIEAALLAKRIAPGHTRRFAFMDWQNYEESIWKALLAKSSASELVTIPPIQASDRDAGAIDMARANAERAGVSQLIEFSQRAVSAIEPARTGWVITNPPYGQRISSNKDLRNLYAQLGNVLRKNCTGWQIAVLCSDLILLGQIKIPLDTSLKLINGGIAVYLARGRIDSTD